ncbi:MAG: hypothetical protein CMJ64_04670 [Planctomycetaceae bacterium]|nr:hypothetical protein [Planctomycetaceae bacterium]
MNKRNPLSEQLRNAILSADKSRYRISQETGITEADLSRFVNDVAGLSLDSIDKIGECLELETTTRNQHPNERESERWRVSLNAMIASQRDSLTLTGRGVH